MVTFSIRCMRHAWLGTVAFLGALLTAQPASGNVMLAQVASDIGSPTDIQNARDGSGRLFFVQQTGQIMVWKNDAEPPTEFLNISSLISAGGERGLLGLAFHPDYRNNGFFYVNYTRSSDGATVVARYSRSANNPNIADPQSAAVLLTIAQPYANHNGGAVRFGPDGYLYIGMGDGGSSNDPQNRAQDLTSLLGKILRIDVNTTTGPLPYGIPPDNPFVRSPQPGVRAEIWAYGLRNPWRFSFDRVAGDLFIGDVGQSSREEINFVRAGSPGGMNFGWRVMEGTQCTNLPGDPPCDDPSFTFTPPIVDYDHDQGCSVTGGYLYRGRAVPELISTSPPGEGQLFKGIYVFGDLCSGTIWRISAAAAGGVSNSVLLDSDLRITTFGEDENGEIYVADAAASEIYRLASTTPVNTTKPVDPTKPIDTTKPAIAITSFPDVLTFLQRGVASQTISIRASDNVGLAKVELFINGNLFLTSTSGQIDQVVDTSMVPAGVYELRAVATDTSDNASQVIKGVIILETSSANVSIINGLCN